MAVDSGNLSSIYNLIRALLVGVFPSLSKLHSLLSPLQTPLLLPLFFHASPVFHAKYLDAHKLSKQLVMLIAHILLFSFLSPYPYPYYITAYEIRYLKAIMVELLFFSVPASSAGCVLNECLYSTTYQPSRVHV